jgi:hypothetical protein
MMQAAFPAVYSRSIGSLEFELSLDNPWFSQAELSWPNKKDGLLEGIRSTSRVPDVRPGVS